MIPHIPTSNLRSHGRSKTLLLSVATILAAAGYADAANFRYYRFTPTKLGSGTAVQISEFEFTKKNTTTNAQERVEYPTGTTVTSSAPNNDGGTAGTDGVKSEAAIKVIDKSTATKWFNSSNGSAGISAIVFDVGAGDPTKTLNIDGYHFATANDSANRNPVSWTLEGSTDGLDWQTLDNQTNYSYTTTTQFLTYTPVFVLQATVPPAISTGTIYNQIVKNDDGLTASVDYSATNATKVVISPTTGVTPTTLNSSFGTLDIDPPNSADTTYTLTATNSANATATQKFTVRSVAGGKATYRYVRFTPKKTVQNFQLADINFYNGTTRLTATANLEGATAADATAEGPAKLADNDATTKMYNAGLVPVVFDFTTSQTFDNYEMRSAADSGTYPGRNPTQWIMEGSDGATGPWTLIENVTAFDYAFPLGGSSTFSLPLPGVSLAPILKTFYSFRDSLTTGSPTVINYGAIAAGRITLKTGSGPETDLSLTDTSVSVSPTAPTTYTLKVYPGDNDPNKAVTKTITLDAPTTTIPATINYATGFSKASDVDFQLLGNTPGFVNDALITLPGDVTRLRLAPDSGTNVQGYAWFKNKVGVSGGFDTTYYAHPTTPTRGYGAEGIAFVVQNTTEGLLWQGTPAEKGPTSNALTVELSAWNNAPVAPDTLNEAHVRVLKGTAGKGTEIFNINLYNIAGIPPFLSTSGYAGLTLGYNGAPYKTRVTYASGKLNIWINDIAVLTDGAVDMSDVVDADGKSYVGFTARSGTITENSDITSWVLTSGAVVAPTTDLKILTSSFDFTASKLSLSFASTSGKTYKITHSATLNGTDWVQVGSNIPATGTTTSTDVTFTKGSKDFFRVELVP